MKLNIYNTEEEVLAKLADYFVQVAKASIAKHNRFSVALSGGSSPKKLYELLASDSYKNNVDWGKVYFFFGDERYVPQTSPDSNYLMAKKALFDALTIPDNQIFAVDTSLEPAAAARDYASAIKDFFGKEEMSFDLVLLGLGDNSHTASLFPHTPVLESSEMTVKEVWLEDQQVYRITLTAPLINSARHIGFLVYGNGKAEAVHSVIEGDLDLKHYPAQLIKPSNGELQWFLDKGAASKLSQANK